MSSNTRATSREEMAAVLEGRGALGGERLLKYNIFLTDAFSGGAAFKDSFYQAPGQPAFVDNDDSYRRSRHLLLGREISDASVNIENLREHSLARQLQTKEDRPATIRLIRRLKPEELAQQKSTEGNLPWVNLIPPNTKFFLEQVQENREEKVQVIDTFGEWIAFFFGRKPEVYSYSGTLLNAQNHDWKNEFQMNYDLFLRGTQAVRYKATVLLHYDDVLVEGFILNSSIQMSAMANNAVPFSFNMLVINRSPVNYRSIIGMRIERSGGTVLEQALFQGLNEALDLTQEGRIDELETFLLMREYFSGHYVPGAGTSVHRPQAGNIESASSTPPGQVGGLINDSPGSLPFEASTTNSIEASGVTSEAYEETGINPLGSGA
jgi:hypothetical protein